MGDGATPGRDRDGTPQPAPVEVASDVGQTDSAPRRTWLAAERTYLAWLRTGLGALGMALAVGRLLPALIDASHLAFGLLGAGFAALGVFLLVLAAYRAQRTRAALAAGQPLPLDFWVVWVLTAASIVLAVATIALIIAEV
jgi:putative membrane protein